MWGLWKDLSEGTTGGSPGSETCGEDWHLEGQERV